MSERDVGQLHSADDLIAAVEQYGFLPFFRNEIHGFSIEELCPPDSISVLLIFLSVIS